MGECPKCHGDEEKRPCEYCGMEVEDRASHDSELDADAAEALAVQRDELLAQASRWRRWLGMIREQAAATLEEGHGFCATCSMVRPGMDALRIVYAQADDALNGREP